LLFLALPLTSVAEEISSDNISRYLGNDRWSWTVFIKGPQQVLNNIECVEYTLHPTFPIPVQRVCGLGDQKYPFALSAIGWGTFQIRIRVFLRDGKVQDLTHHLRFEAEGK
jgi:transcription initiation factor IIF auxiliary subunit